jgi:hypothetical protein
MGGWLVERVVAKASRRDILIQSLILKEDGNKKCPYILEYSEYLECSRSRDHQIRLRGNRCFGNSFA